MSVRTPVSRPAPFLTTHAHRVTAPPPSPPPSPRSSKRRSLVAETDPPPPCRRKLHFDPPPPIKLPPPIALPPAAPTALLTLATDLSNPSSYARLHRLLRDSLWAASLFHRPVLTALSCPLAAIHAARVLPLLLVSLCSSKDALLDALLDALAVHALADRTELADALAAVYLTCAHHSARPHPHLALRHRAPTLRPLSLPPASYPHLFALLVCSVDVSITHTQARRFLESVEHLVTFRSTNQLIPDPEHTPDPEDVPHPAHAALHALALLCQRDQTAPAFAVSGAAAILIRIRNAVTLHPRLCRHTNLPRRIARLFALFEQTSVRACSSLSISPSSSPSPPRRSQAPSPSPSSSAALSPLSLSSQA